MEMTFKKGDRVLVTNKLIDNRLPNGKRWLNDWADEMDEVVGRQMFVTRIPTEYEIGLAFEPANEKSPNGRFDGINGFLYPPCCLRLIERDGKPAFHVGQRIKVTRASEWAGWTDTMTENLVGNEYEIEALSLDYTTPTVRAANGWWIPVEVIEIVGENEQVDAPLQAWEKF